MLVREFEVHDFGPIREGRVEIGDLTLLIGPQNSGKTYLSMLLYTLSELGDHITDIIIDEIAKVVFSYGRGIRGRSAHDVVRELALKHLDEIKERVIRAIKESSQRFMTSELRACFLAYDLRTLVRKSAEKARVLCIYGLDKQEFRIDMSISHEVAVENIKLSEGLLRDFIVQFFGNKERPPARALYVPADRLAIISSLSSYISLLLDIHRHIFERASAAEILRQVGFGVRKPLLDYIKIVDLAIKGARLPVETELSGSVLGIGSFSVEKGRIWYEDHRGVKIPIELASSGIAQLIGIILPLSAILSPSFPLILFYGAYDMVIIEEPEVNLHADLHIEVARFLADLSRRLKVFITTHSHYVLAELSNLLVSGELKGLKAYFVDPETGLIEPLAVDEREGVELPRSIERALSSLAEEALRSLKGAYPG